MSILNNTLIFSRPVDKFVFLFFLDESVYHSHFTDVGNM